MAKFVAACWAALVSFSTSTLPQFLQAQSIQIHAACERHLGELWVEEFRYAVQLTRDAAQQWARVIIPVLTMAVDFVYHSPETQLILLVLLLILISRYLFRRYISPLIVQLTRRMYPLVRPFVRAYQFVRDKSRFAAILLKHLTFSAVAIVVSKYVAPLCTSQTLVALGVGVPLARTAMLLQPTAANFRGMTSMVQYWTCAGTLWALHDLPLAGRLLALVPLWTYVQHVLVLWLLIPGLGSSDMVQFLSPRLLRLFYFASTLLPLDKLGVVWSLALAVTPTVVQGYARMVTESGHVILLALPFLFMPNFLLRVGTTVVGMLYPAYRGVVVLNGHPAVKADSRDKYVIQDRCRQILMYWVAAVVIVAVYRLLDRKFSGVPFWYTTELLLLTYIQLPFSKVTEKVFAALMTAHQRPQVQEIIVADNKTNGKINGERAPKVTEKEEEAKKEEEDENAKEKPADDPEQRGGSSTGKDQVADAGAQANGSLHRRRKGRPADGIVKDGKKEKHAAKSGHGKDARVSAAEGSSSTSEHIPASGDKESSDSKGVVK